MLTEHIDPLVGTMLGKDYRVLEPIGAGGMAVVYLVEHQTLLKRFAAKVLSPVLASSLEARARFAQEAHAASQLDHENIVSISDFGVTSDQRPYFVMELLRGQTLDQRLSDRPMTIEEVVAVAVPVARALSHAHHEGIVHLDVKPENIFLVQRSQGRWGVKVVDFGIAKAATQVHQTVAGETKGTPSMMAPEQRVGEQVDVRADVYSVAAVGFEILTGHGVNLDLAALAHLGIDNWPHLPLPSSLRTDLPTELDEILLHTMSFERDRRPADCAAFESLCEAVMKAHNLTASDKDIARWVESELRHLPVAFGGIPVNLSKSPPV